MFNISAHNAQDNYRLNRVAVKLFFAICEEWTLSDQQKQVLAGLGTRTTLHNWKKKLDAGENIKLSKDTLDRLSYIAGIYKALQLLFTSPAQWKSWIKKPNRDFGGQSALDRMLAGQVVDLYKVRSYLDGWRGDNFA